MLVVSRRVGQSVIIDGKIKVMLVKVKGSNEVRLGFEAPKDVSIQREEIYEENLESERED